MLIEPLVEGEDVRTRVVAFDDPRAGWRVLHVTVEVEETLAGSPADELVLDWFMGAPAGRGPDARAIGQALKDLGRLVVLSKAAPDRPTFIPGHTALNSGYGIGRVAADGTLDFPLITGTEGPSTRVFQHGIDTLDELRDAAQKPTRIERR